MKAKARENTGSIRRCAFCKHWYDPTNSVIAPTKLKGMWEYDDNVKNKCLLNRMDRKSNAICGKFESKV